MSEPPCELDVSGPAVRAIRDTLPEAVACAVIEFLTGSLVENPRRVGKQLVGDLVGSARRGAYRVVYRIDEHARRVVVLRVEHNADAHRPR